MPNLTSTFPLVQNLAASATITTNTTGSAQAIPYAQSYRFLFTIGTVTGTSPTLIGCVATSYDGGTTFQDVLTTTTLSTTGQGCSIVFRPYLGAGEISTAQGSSATATATINPTAGTVANGPIDPRYIKIKWVVGGTSPNFATAACSVICVPQDSSD